MRFITLLTDFGTRDPYVAEMKGVIAGRCDARVVDLTHEITPFDVFEAAWFLARVAPWWPEGTIFVAVVDPSVGTARKILAYARERQIFLAPDNGLLTFVAADADVVSVENEAFFLPRGSSTFHGRDRFAPVAAALAKGTALSELGPPLANIVRLDYNSPSYGEELVTGTVVAVDRFGNLITDIERKRLPFDSPQLRARGVTVGRLASSYAEGGSRPFMIIGSTGRIEISVANGSAAELLHLRRGDRVEIRPS